MNILFLDWECFGKVDTIFTLEHELGHKVTNFFHKDYQLFSSSAFDQYFDEVAKSGSYDLCFSFNFYPIVSTNCQRYNIKYVSYLYDSPFSLLYTDIIKNPCNYVFLFDKTQYNELKSKGIDTIYYLTLPVNGEIIEYLNEKEYDHEKCDADVSFVGSLYNESDNFFSLLNQANDYTKGYLDSIMSAQLKISGYNFIEEVLTPPVLDELNRVSPFEHDPLSTVPDSYIYGNYYIDRKLTEIERIEMLTAAGKVSNLKLYTLNKNVDIPGVKNMGAIDYYDEMPYVFHNSKINLNITLRSIKSGIPLRCMDILGAGGFLLTNFQADFLDYFIPDVDFVYYTDSNDLCNKITYYLEHDEERKQIAHNGHEKVKKYHSFKQRFTDIFKIVQQN